MSDHGEPGYATLCAGGVMNFDGAHYDAVVFAHLLNAAEARAARLDDPGYARHCPNGPHTVKEIRLDLRHIPPVSIGDKEGN